MKIKCIMHADFESPGVIETWAQDRGYGFEICKPYRGEDCHEDKEFDFLIIMGGPQSPLSIDEAPYLLDEIELIQDAIVKKKLVLGFCLGAQLISEALGGKTQRSPEKEVGVYRIVLTEEGVKDSILGNFPKQFGDSLA